MSFKKLIAVTASALLLQGCVASMGGTKAPSKEYHWDEKASFAMNVMRAADLDNGKIRDTEVPKEAFQNGGSVNNGVISGTLTGLSAWSGTSGFMGLSGGAALGLGLLDFLTHNEAKQRWGDLRWDQFIVFKKGDHKNIDQIKKLALEAKVAFARASVDAWNIDNENGVVNRVITGEMSVEGDKVVVTATKSTSKGTRYEVSTEIEADPITFTNSYPVGEGEYIVFHLYPANRMGYSIPATLLDMLPPDTYVFRSSEHGSEKRDPNKLLGEAPRLHDLKSIHLFIIPEA